jgi:hypothetical protein
MAQSSALEGTNKALESDGNLELLLKAVLDLTDAVVILTTEVKEFKEFIILMTK